MQGKDHRTDGIKSMIPHWEHWLNVAGLCRDGMTLSAAYVQARLNGDDYTPIAPVPSAGNDSANSKVVDPDSPLRSPADLEKPLFADAADEQQQAGSGSDEELVE